MLKRLIKIVLFVFLFLIVCLIGLVLYIKAVSRIHPPKPLSSEALKNKVTEIDSGLFVSEKNWFRKSESGLYELYVEGAPFERGVAIGLLTKDLVQYQEKVFNDQIRNIIPSRSYLEVLKYFIGWYNRKLPDYVSEEYQLEIYGISLAASSEYNYIAEPYQRLLNYHAAHDIGHALQNMSLVGCTSFATWGSNSEDSTLLIGRNFDFYVGEEFARNKVVAFYKPDDGYKFMMVTFGGMAGVLSGMNTQGLTVTINAAKSDIPASAATPVSLVAREILQYAATIEEAYLIAERRKMFVAESFLIGSAKDGKAAIIEKSNDSIGLYDPHGSFIACTNHFQSEVLGNTKLNHDHIGNSASAYRHQRLVELLAKNGKNNVQKTVDILRDQKGVNGQDIGLANEKVINQLIAHHSIVFQPEKKLVWVSTAPWQLGKFVCYDLDKIFSTTMTMNKEIYEQSQEIKPDSFLLTPAYTDFLKMSKYRLPFADKADINPDSIVKWNPNSYHAHMLAGDYYLDHDDYARATAYYEKALGREIATKSEQVHIHEKLSYCKEKLQ